MSECRVIGYVRSPGHLDDTGARIVAREAAHLCRLHFRQYGTLDDLLGIGSARIGSAFNDKDEGWWTK